MLGCPTTYPYLLDISLISSNVRLSNNVTRFTAYWLLLLLVYICFTSCRKKVTHIELSLAIGEPPRIYTYIYCLRLYQCQRLTMKQSLNVFASQVGRGHNTSAVQTHYHPITKKKILSPWATGPVCLLVSSCVRGDIGVTFLLYHTITLHNGYKYVLVVLETIFLYSFCIVLIVEKYTWRILYC